MSLAVLYFPSATGLEVVRWAYRVVSCFHLAPTHQMDVPVGLLNPSSTSKPFFLVLGYIHSV